MGLGQAEQSLTFSVHIYSCLYCTVQLPGASLAFATKKFQIPLRTPQRPQPAFNPIGVFVHFTFCCHKCTHFAWPNFLLQLFSHNVIRHKCTHFAWPSFLVQLFSHNVIRSLAIYCNQCRHFAVYLHTLTLYYQNTSLCTHCAWISSTTLHLYFSPASVHSWTVYNCTVQLYTRQCQPFLY